MGLREVSSDEQLRCHHACQGHLETSSSNQNGCFFCLKETAKSGCHSIETPKKKQRAVGCFFWGNYPSRFSFWNPKKRGTNSKIRRTHPPTSWRVELGRLPTSCWSSEIAFRQILPQGGPKGSVRNARNPKDSGGGGEG